MTLQFANYLQHISDCFGNRDHSPGSLPPPVQNENCTYTPSECPVSPTPQVIVLKFLAIGIFSVLNFQTSIQFAAYVDQIEIMIIAE